MSALSAFAVSIGLAWSKKACDGNVDHNESELIDILKFIGRNSCELIICIMTYDSVLEGFWGIVHRAEAQFAQ